MVGPPLHAPRGFFFVCLCLRTEKKKPYRLQPCGVGGSGHFCFLVGGEGVETCMRGFPA